jgi:hypothetical protein
VSVALFLLICWRPGVDVNWTRYWAYKNAESMDGLSGMRRGVDTAKREQVQPIKKMVGQAAVKKSPNTLSSISPFAVALSSFVAGLVVAFLLLEILRGDLQEGLITYTEEIRALFK